MKRYQFARSVMVEGVLFKAGQIVTDEQISGGCLASCLHIGSIAEAPPEPKPEVKVEPKPEPKAEPKPQPKFEPKPPAKK